MTSAVLGRHEHVPVQHTHALSALRCGLFWSFAESCKLRRIVTLNARPGGA